MTNENEIQDDPPLSDDRDVWYSEELPGREGYRSASEPEWTWSHHAMIKRSGPSPEVQKRIRQMTGRLGPPPDDLEIYGVFDDAEKILAALAVQDAKDNEAIAAAAAAQAELREKMQLEAGDVGDAGDVLGPL